MDKAANAGMLNAIKALFATRGSRAATMGGLGALSGAAHGIGAGDDASGVLAKTLAGAGGMAALGGGFKAKHLPTVLGLGGAAGAGALGYKTLADKGIVGQPVEDKRKFF